MKSMRFSVVGVLLLGCLSALAVPPNRVVLMEANGDILEKRPLGSWQVHSSDPQVVEAQLLATNEVHLHSLRPGNALLFWYNQAVGQVEIWKVRVGETAPSPIRPEAKVICGPCRCEPASNYPILCTVENERCLRVLEELLPNSDLSADDLQVRYSVEVLQVLLKKVKSKLDNTPCKGVSLAFSGANLVLRGEVSDPARLWELLSVVYQNMVGKLVIEDQLRFSAKETK